MRMTLEQYRQRFPRRQDPVPAEYLGQWIAWDDNHKEIIAHGDNLREVVSRAKDAGCVEPIMQKIPRATFVGIGGA